MGRISGTAKKMNLILAGIRATRTTIGSIRDEQGTSLLDSYAKSLLIIDEFHMLNLGSRREGAKMQAEKIVIDQVPSRVGPLESLLHVKAEMVPVYMISEH